MKIQVLGSGCPTCKKFHEVVKKAVEELNLGIEVEYIPEVQKLIELGLMSSPALVMKDKPVIVGFVSEVEKVKEKIKENI